MKTKTETILTVLKFLALLGAIGFAIECGSQLLSFIASFVNPEWASKTYNADASWITIRAYSQWYYVMVMSLVIAISALKAFVWFLIFSLLRKLQLHSPFSAGVAAKLEQIAYLLFGIWIVTTIMFNSYVHYLEKASGIRFHEKNTGEYFFITGIVFIVSQIFRRGIELQEENQLTV